MSGCDDFSDNFPGPMAPSHVAAETPGSIYEGGERGYSLAHACGAAFDNPDLIVTCIIGADVVLACAGDVPTLEVLAAVTLLRGYAPDLRIRVVNVGDLMVLQPQSDHPHEDREFDALFTTDRPVIFAFHGYPTMIHKLTYRRHNHDNFQVRGYREEGATTTPFDMVVLNNLERYQLALDAIRRVQRLRGLVPEATDRYWSTIERHKLYVSEPGEDMPEVADWRWSPAPA